MASWSSSGSGRSVVAAALIVAAAAGSACRRVESPAGGSGVVVVAVREGSVLAAAGLEPGDEVVGWRDGSGDAAASLDSTDLTPATRQGGPVDSVFDWYRLRIEREPTPATEILVDRRGERRRLVVPAGPWRTRVRPRLARRRLSAVERAETLARQGKTLTAVAIYDRLAQEELRRGSPSTACWFLLELLDADRGTRYRSIDGLAERYRTAIRRWTEAEGESLAIARSHVDLAEAAWKRDHLDLAIDSLAAGLALQERLEPRSLTVASMENNLGIALANRGDLGGSIGHLERALEISRALVPDGEVVADLINNLGVFERRRGNLEAAEERLQEALELRRAQEPEGLRVARALTNLGTVALERGDLELAEARTLAAHRILTDRDPGSLHEANLLHNLAAIEIERGDLLAARSHIERAQAIRRAIAPDGLDLAAGAGNLAELAMRAGDLEDAQAHLDRALDIQRRKAPRSLAAAGSLYRLGNVALERGAIGLAQEHYREALRIQQILAPRSWKIALTLAGLGQASRLTGEPEAAVDLFERAVAILEEQTGRLTGTDGGQVGIHHRFEDTYRRYLELLLDLGRTEDAFHLLERSRARSLLSLLATRDLDLADEASDRIAVERRRLAARYDRLQGRMAALDPEADGERIAQLRAQLIELGESRARLARQAQREAPGFAALTFPQPLRPAAVRRALDAGTKVLSYQVGEDRTHLFVLAADGHLAVTRLPIGEARLRSEVEHFRALVAEARRGSRRGERRMRSLVDAGKRLYELLVEPAGPALEGAQRLLVLADGPLHRLPFAALVAETGGSGPGDRPWRYLAEAVPIHSAVSATLYAELKKSRSEPGAPSTAAGPFVGFADPALRMDPDDGPPLARRSAPSALPASRLEVESIARLFPDRAEVYLGGACSEDRVRRSLAGARYAHFATHAVIDDRLPLNSALVLSRGPEARGRSNGLLQAWEIFEDVRTPAELVVLSACESALGPEAGGEGLMGLTRAFHYAGARSVIASLWEASDEMTSQLMVRFYRHLEAGAGKDEALRAAQVELIGGEVPGGSAPFYWATFQLYGDWR